MSQSAQWPTVLYVETSEDDALLFRVAYRKTRCRFYLQELRSISEGREFLKRTGVDAIIPDLLVLLDYDLNGETGLDLLRWIRQTPRFQHLPVIIFSGEAEGKAQQCYEAGVNYCVLKGTDFDSLVALCACLDECLACSPPNFEGIAFLQAYQARPTLPANPTLAAHSGSSATSNQEDHR